MITIDTKSKNLIYELVSNNDEDLTPYDLLTLQVEDLHETEDKIFYLNFLSETIESNRIEKYFQHTYEDWLFDPGFIPLKKNISNFEIENKQSEIYYSKLNHISLVKKRIKKIESLIPNEIKRWESYKSNKENKTEINRPTISNPIVVYEIMDKKYKDEDYLNGLHTKLHSGQFIDSNKNYFKKLFSNNRIEKPYINWNGTLSEVCYFIYELKARKIINFNRKTKLQTICKTFTVNNEIIENNKQTLHLISELISSFSKNKNIPSNALNIKQILDDLIFF